MSPEVRRGQLVTERELTVLELMSAGLTDREIASRLAIHEGTVKNYMRLILPKLNARSRPHAVARGIELGILTVAGGTRGDAAVRPKTALARASG